MKKRSAEEKRYFLVSLALMLLSNLISFQGSRLLTQNRTHFSLALPADAVFPFLPWTISVYFGCFAAWFLMYRFIAGLPRERADRFFGANILGKGVCLLFFVFLPTAIVRPQVSGTTFWDAAVRFLYWIDAPDNLFPSLHCLISWLCWIGIRGDREVPLSLRAAAAVMAVLVCISTLTTRQHVLADAFAGILLSEISYGLAGIPAVRGAYARLADRLAGCLVSR